MGFQTARAWKAPRPSGRSERDVPESSPDESFLSSNQRVECERKHRPRDVRSVDMPYGKCVRGTAQCRNEADGNAWNVEQAHEQESMSDAS